MAPQGPSSGTIAFGGEFRHGLSINISRSIFKPFFCIIVLMSNTEYISWEHVSLYVDTPTAKGSWKCTVYEWWCGWKNWLHVIYFFTGFCMFVLSLVKKHYRLQFYMVCISEITPASTNFPPVSCIFQITASRAMLCNSNRLPKRRFLETHLAYTSSQSTSHLRHPCCVLYDVSLCNWLRKEKALSWQRATIFNWSVAEAGLLCWHFFSNTYQK